MIVWRMRASWPVGLHNKSIEAMRQPNGGFGVFSLSTSSLRIPKASLLIAVCTMICTADSFLITT